MQTPNGVTEDALQSVFERSYALLETNSSNKSLPACLEDRNIAGAGRPHGYQSNAMLLDHLLPQNLQLTPLNLQAQPSGSLPTDRGMPPVNHLPVPKEPHSSSPRTQAGLPDSEELPNDFHSKSTHTRVAVQHGSVGRFGPPKGGGPTEFSAATQHEPELGDQKSTNASADGKHKDMNT